MKNVFMIALVRFSSVCSLVSSTKNLHAIRRFLVVVACAYIAGCAHPGMWKSAVDGSGVALLNFQTVRDKVMRDVPGMKKGESCSNNFLGLVAWGDNSVAKAKEKAKISRVASVDVSIVDVLGIYGRNCTIVTGSEYDQDCCSSPQTPATAAR